MLDGLEAVELKLSEVLEDNETKRIDSEYFKKDFLTFIEILKNLNYSRLENISNVKGGKRLPLGEDFSDEGIAYIRAEDNKKGFVSYENSPKISIALHNQLKAYQTKYDDVLLTIVGNSIGDVGIVKFNLKKCNLTENCVKVTNLKDNIKANYIFSFLNSKFGQWQISREKVGTAQPKLAIERIRKFIIPNLDDTFQLQIESLVKASYQKLEESKALYIEAEELLLKELDLLDFKPSDENIATKSFKESFGISGRLDSEYYQPKYDEIVEKIKSYKGGFENLQTACKLKDNNYTPKENQYYPYVELSNIGNTGDITGFTYEMGQDLPSRARRVIRKDDVIISSIEGSLEKVALVTKEFDNSLCSTGFYIIDSKKINSETLLVLFKNRVFQQILKQNCSGTILTAINKDEFLNIVIPIIDTTIQIQIEEKIKKSFGLKEESKQLLDLAKKAVEVAIEKNEDEAIKIINEASK